MKSPRVKLKNDVYRKTRGGRTKLLRLYCESCEGFLFSYQKDGPGPLKRLYLDRIVSDALIGTGKDLVCFACKKVIGTFFIYEKEQRPAFRLYQSAVVKKTKTGR